MFVPIVLEEDEAVAAMIACKSVLATARMLASDAWSLSKLDLLESAMTKLAKDIDTAHERAAAQAVRSVPDVPRREATGA